VPEPAGTVDLATTGAEVALVGVVLTLLGGRERRRVANLLLGAGVLLWALRLSGRLP
jgi:steroid 5-alpha reductase family enzyme